MAVFPKNANYRYVFVSMGGCSTIDLVRSTGVEKFARHAGLSEIRSAEQAQTGFRIGPPPRHSQESFSKALALRRAIHPVRCR